MFNINDVSRMLREARIQKNLTQNALADQMGVSYQAVSNWERGTSVPDISNLARLCEILELDLYKRRKSCWQVRTGWTARPLTPLLPSRPCCRPGSWRSWCGRKRRISVI